LEHEPCTSPIAGSWASSRRVFSGRRPAPGITCAFFSFLFQFI
jgi:hypothetical protein